jgi:hypothetical protein
MRSPAGSIAWEFRQKHRWGLIGVVAYLLVIGTIKLLMLQAGRQFTLGDAESFALVVVVPISWMFTYFLAVFTFGLSGDIAARQSMYPARNFTLPVTTAALAGLPMLYGSAVIAVLWVAMRLFAIWPADIDVPVVWPGLLVMTLLAWAQALTWMPYGLPGLRVIVTVLWLAVIETAAFVAMHFKAREPVMLAMLAPLMPLAYLAACVAVARARRGDVPDWRGAFVRRIRVGTAGGASVARAPFRSAARAQAWFEWRRNGLTLPGWVAILLPFELALLWAAGDAPALIFAILIGALLTPPLMAAFAAATVRKSNPDARDSLGMSPFIATRPMTDAQLIAAKLKATLWSTIAAWLLVLIAIPIALVWSDTWPVVSDRARRFAEDVGTPRAMVALLLVLTGLTASTWKQLVQTLWVGLTGRAWVVNASIVLALLVLSAIGPILISIAESRRVIAALLDSLPLILAVLVGIKMPTAFWLVTRLHRRGVLGDRALVTAAAAWLVAVLALYGVLVWLAGWPLVARYFLAMVAILAIPLTRLAAAPLALAWNRHR